MSLIPLYSKLTTGFSVGTTIYHLIHTIRYEGYTIHNDFKSMYTNYVVFEMI